MVCEIRGANVSCICKGPNMTKTEFFKLLKKFEEGNCSKSEDKILHTFCEEVQIKGFEESWNISDKQEARIRLFRRIMVTVEAPQEQKRKKGYLWQIAAVFAGLIAAGYIYWEISSSSALMVPTDDAITLELGDGSIKIIEENTSTPILGANGNIVGKQNNGTLVYDKVQESKEIEYHTLKVPYGKKFQLELSDGSLAYLNAGSTIKYPIQFLKEFDRQVFVQGEAFFEVAKDASHPFIVNADQLDIKVLGTKFNVHAYGEDDSAEVVLVEGSVGLSSKNGLAVGESLVLKPGQKGSFNKEEHSMSSMPVATDVYTSWMQGKLVFRDMRFQNILKKLERRYDVTIINGNPKLAKEKFNASFDDITIAKVFESLKKYHGINYSVSKDTITVK